MEYGIWGACDSQPLQQVGMFNGTESQASLISCHAESPYPHYWPSEAWRTDEIPDISLMSVDPLAFDPVLSLPAVVTGESIIHDKFPQQGQWGHNMGSPADSYPTQDVQEILNSQFMPFNSSPHLAQDFNSFKAFGTITPVQHSSPVTSANTQYAASSLPPSNRPNASQYGGAPVSMGMFPPTNVPQRIISTSGMDGGRGSNMSLMHLPKRHHPVKTGGNVVDGSSISSVPGASTFVANQKSSSLLPTLADSSASSHRRDSVAEEPKMASFNPGPYVNSARGVLPTQKQQEDAHRMWLDNNNRGKSSAMPIPNSGHRQQHQQAMSNSSPVMNLSGFEQRPMSNASPVINLSYEQRAMSNSSPVTNLPGFELRHQKSMSNSTPATRMGFEQQMPKQQSLTSSSPIPTTIVGFEPSQQQHQASSSPVVPIMGLQQHQSSSPIPVSGFEPRQQQPMSSPSPSPNSSGFEQRQQSTLSTSPPLSNLSFEPRQPPPPMSSSPSTSNLVFEPRRQQPISNPSPLPNSARQQQPAATNPRSAVPDAAESASKWPAIRMVGGYPGVPGSEKAPIMRQQPETGTIKCALPRSTGANSSPAANANPANKRPLWADDNKNNQGGSMNKKPMQKWQGTAGCSRLEEISNAAHQKVTQNTSGRALGPALNTNLKPRARQGSANDPQSIAARVRRERISERLKVLQTLIPNGDKVDMVTMLEKAINYVQCLELQIKMLKNDSLWPKALGPLPNTLQELIELAGPEFLGVEETTPAEKTTTTSKKSPPEVIEFDGNQPSTDKE